MRRLLAVMAIACTGCIDFASEYYARCADAGVCGGPPPPPVDAGGDDAGPPDAGYDGGTPCSSRPRLRCDDPIVLENGVNPVVAGALAATNTGFVAAWVGGTVEVRLVHGDRSQAPLITGQPVTGATLLAVGTAGDHWAAAWASRAAETASCQTDSSTGGPTTVTTQDGGAFKYALATAINANGEVAITSQNATGSDYPVYAGWSSGCPTQVPLIPDSTNIQGVSVASTSADGGGGFRFLYSKEDFNTGIGSISMLELDGDAGAKTSVSSNSDAPGALASATSTSGDTVFTAVVGEDGNQNFIAGALGMSADLTGTSKVTYFFPDPWWISAGQCGPGCMALGVIPNVTQIPSVFFYSADSAAKNRGGWDVACVGTSLVNNPTISVAGFNGRVGVLLTGDNTAKLYVCDLPPLP